MNILERINQKLTQKNTTVADRPPNSDLVLLLGRAEIREIEGMRFAGYKLTSKIGGEWFFLDLRTIPVDFESYLDIVRVI
jgi:hypothetical protein